MQHNQVISWEQFMIKSVVYDKTSGGRYLSTFFTYLYFTEVRTNVSLTWIPRCLLFSVPQTDEMWSGATRVLGSTSPRTGTQLVPADSHMNMTDWPNQTFFLLLFYFLKETATAQWRYAPQSAVFAWIKPGANNKIMIQEKQIHLLSKFILLNS